MFFYLIRPLIRWKINLLLDDDKQPGGFFLWLLKKDGNSWQYYQNLLQLDAKLRESVSGLSEALIPESTLDGKTRVDSTRRVESYKNTRQKKILYATGLSVAVVLLIAVVLFLRPGPDSEIIARIPPQQPVVVKALPLESAGLSPDEFALPELQRLTEQVVPSGVREVFAPAFVPLRETYAVGRDKLLDDLGSLPIQPLTDFSRRLYSVRGVSDFKEMTPKDEMESPGDESLLSRWLNPDLLKINWLNSDSP